MSSFYLYDEINDQLALSFNKFVRNNIFNSKTEPLDIYINSDGGDYTSALSIIDVILIARSRGVQITTVVDGKAYSAAAFIFCFGDIRIVNKHSHIMMHPVYYENPEQTLSEIKAATDFVHIEYMKFLSDIKEHCKLNISTEELYDRLTRNWWLNSEEALEYGIANTQSF